MRTMQYVLPKEMIRCAEQINQALDEITKDGTMQKINDYYIGVNAGKDRYQADPKNPKKKKLTMADQCRISTI